MSNLFNIIFFKTMYFILCWCLFLLLCLKLKNIYNRFQIKRNDAVFIIKVKWIITKDLRFDKYKYDDMLKPSIKNFFGLKYPKEKDFK